jgi:cytochrome c biogenesis protein CcmG, thiol:disulfide interchange protein DsbE
MKIMKRRDFLKMISCAGLATILPQCRSGSLQTGDPAPGIAVMDLSGRKLILPGDFKGKGMLLHFWASWCSRCVDEMRDLQAIYVRYRNRGVLPCSVSIGDTKEAADAYLRDVHVTYPVVLDQRATSKKLYSITGVPTTYGISREGMVRFRVLGPIGKDIEERVLNMLL